MADAELLLTINGTDVTESIWEWSSVTLDDSWSARGSLSFTIRQAFGAAAIAPAYADVRLRNLLTGVVLFEGIVSAGPQARRVVDPTWIDTDVSCVAYDALFDTSALQSAFNYTFPGGGYPTAKWMIGEVIRRSFADYRVPTTITEYIFPGSHPSTYLEWGMDLSITQWDWPALTNLAQAINEVIGQSMSYEYDSGGPYADGFHIRAHRLKWLPGLGLVLADPLTNIRGTAPVTLTTASFGRPADSGLVTDTTGVHSGAVARDPATYSTPDDTRIVTVDRAPTNSYLVLGDEFTSPFNFGSSAADTAVLVDFHWPGGSVVPQWYRVVSPQMPHDVLVGHELTFNDPVNGTVTGVVQSVSTRFLDGVYDQTSQSWPYFLDSGRLFDGTWNLDASVSSVIPRRMRVTTMTIAGAPKTFIGRLRRFRSL